MTNSTIEVQRRSTLKIVHLFMIWSRTYNIRQIKLWGVGNDTYNKSGGGGGGDESSGGGGGGEDGGVGGSEDSRDEARKEHCRDMRTFSFFVLVSINHGGPKNHIQQQIPIQWIPPAIGNIFFVSL